MANQIDWNAILKDRFPTFKTEEECFLNSLSIASSMEVYIEQIYEGIKNDANVPANLVALYKEAAAGGNPLVVRRIRNRVGNIRRSLR